MILIRHLEKLQVQQRDTLAALEVEIKKKEKKEDTEETFKVGDRVRIKYLRSLNPFTETEDSIGLVTKITKKRVKVESEKSNQVWYRAPHNIKKIPHTEPNVD